jgi:hypothetical protein
MERKNRRTESMTESRAEWRTEWMKDRVDELNGWPVGRRRGSAKVQIGAELLCKSAKVRVWSIEYREWLESIRSKGNRRPDD